MGTKAFYWSGQAEGYADEILIKADKNPNTAGVKLIAPTAKPFAELASDVGSGGVKHVIALGGATPGDASTDTEQLRSATVITVAAHEGPLASAAKVLLPATSWAEHNGTYVNFSGHRQQSEKALEPQGASKPAWEQIAALARAMGLEPSFSKLKQIRSQLGESGAAQPAVQDGPSAQI
jgi:NADH-quinone oxidoreductase subunit G